MKGRTKSSYVQCDKWGNYKKPVAVEEAYDEALYELVEQGKVYTTITSAGEEKHFRNKK